MLHFPRWKIIAIIGACLISVLFALPNFLNESQRAALAKYLPVHTVNLGLDLQGGSHLLLAIDTEAYMREQLQNLSDALRAKLRERKLGYRGLTVQDGAVQVSLRDAPKDTDLRTIIREIDRETLVEEDQNGVFRIMYSDKWERERMSQLIEQSLEIVARRVDETGTREPIIQRQGDDRILVQVPGLTDPEHLKGLLGRTANMTFHLVDANATPSDVERGVVGAGTRIVAGDEKDVPEGQQPLKYAVQSRVLLSGDMLVDAHATYDNTTGEPVVAFRFNAEGAQKFGKITAENIGRPFAIVLDNKVITAPVIRSAILGGSGIISGNFTAASANDLALLLRAGALPAPLTVIEERTVGPSLGNDSIQAGMHASVVGIGLVILFMILFYGRFGMYANIAMLVNAFMTLSLLSLFQATLTLPGIAGIVLTVGMAVDANVLIYERMREEMRNGKSALASAESGFKMAFGTIIDSHVTTFLAAIILYNFGTGSVKGFAVTLAIGIVCSLFTAVLVTRLMVASWLKRTRPKVLPI